MAGDYSRPQAKAPPPVRPDRPFYVVAGSDAYLRTEALAELKNRLAQDLDPTSGALVEYRGEEAELAAVLDDARTPALLAPRRVVVVRDADPFVSLHREALERYLDNPSDCGVLVLDCKVFQASTRLYKRLANDGGLVLAAPPDRRELPRWAVRRAAAYQRVLSHDAARELIELTGTELGRIDAELSKLATFVGDRPRIEVSDVQAIAGEHRLHKVFAVTNALARRDLPQALKDWDRTLASDRAAAFKAIGGLASGVRMLTVGKRQLAAGLSIAEIKQRGRFFFSLDELAAQLKSFRLDDLEQMLVRLLRIDVASKSGGLDVPTAVQRFVASYYVKR